MVGILLRSSGTNSDDSSALYAQGSHIPESCPTDVVVRRVVLVEQLGQLVECLLTLVGDHSAKLEISSEVLSIRGTKQSHKGTMTRNSVLQHRSWQSASPTAQCCCADNNLAAGLCHCNVESEK